MPMYAYTAIDAKGELTRSTLVAASPTAAANAILAKGLTPMEIREAEEGSGGDLNSLLLQFGRIRLQEILLFLQMMAALLGSGITITESIAVLHEQMINRRFKYVLGEVKMQIEGGVSFSESLGRFPSVFPEVVVNMLKAGEAGGILERVLSDLVIYLEKKAALRKMLIRSLLYPSVVLVVAIGVVIFLVVFVIPKFTVLLQGSKLPWNTQLMLDISDFMIANAKTLIMGALATIALLITLFNLEQTRQLIDRYKVFLPVLGPIARMGVIVQFARTLGSLLNSGIPLVEALSITRDTLTNKAARTDVDQVADKVAEGEQLSVVLAKGSLFTSLMIAMVRIGEQSGNLDKQVTLVADLYEQQLEDRIKWMSSLIEPMLIIFLGGVVGFVAWSLVAGMLALYKA
ncbi:type II secretion system F family protein [Desulfobulbus rhabdoformis]|uniref:type II secretion system F family protein n=1 Tax=Desulfobulbus rhabdoformis TaxID=34032 RepID=UPI0019647F1D|nr:type II secretion system F family protein [Desulfobulbus rhabdoformis]MBM9612850.1 type II secretion system F family protein [Desulfobulbus rhabdoformis]